MGALKFLAAIISSLKDPKAAGGAASLAGLMLGGSYMITDQVNFKHAEAMGKIERNSQKVEAITAQMAEAIATLRVIKNSIDDVKESVKDTKAQVNDTRDKVWQIGRDVYTLKNK